MKDEITAVEPAQQAPGGFWLPQPSSTVAGEVDFLFYAILGICIFFFLLISFLTIWFTLKYQQRPGHHPQPSPHHNAALELVWSVIPAGIVLWIAYEGVVGYLDLRTVPPNTEDVSVIAKKWSWAFRYPNGEIDSELHAVVDVPTKLTMRSDDVIHSLYIPAFRVKMDVVPGRYTTTWFQATIPGEYQLFCTEYCGKAHSDMLAKVKIHASEAEFATYMDELQNPKGIEPKELGRRLYLKRGCVQCHSIDGTVKPGGGPSFKGTYGTKQSLANGETVEIDDNYIIESIKNPTAKIRGGYKPGMPSFAGQFKDSQLDALVAFIKSLKD